MNILRNRKGSTVTEVLMALAVLGIISIPLIAVFSNSIFMTRLTKEQMEVNSVMQIIKNEVVQSVKNSRNLTDVDDSPVNLSPIASPRDSVYDPSINQTNYLKIENGNLQDRYVYKVFNKGINATESGNIANSVKLQIKIYTSNYKFIKELIIDVSYDL